MPNDRYVSSAYVRLVLAAYPKLESILVESIGADYQSQLDQEYIDGGLLETILSALEAQGVDSLLLKFGRHIHLATHGPLGVAALAAPNLKTSLATLVEFVAIRSSYYSSQLNETESTITASISAHSEIPIVRQWLVEIAIDLTRAVVETTMGHEIGSQIDIGFMHARPKYHSKLAQFMGAQCRFSTGADYLTIPASWGNVRSPLADATSFHDAIAQSRDTLFNLTHAKNSVTSVRHILEQYFIAISPRVNKGAKKPMLDSRTLPCPPSLTDIARELHLTPRTLTRKLRARGTGYKELLADIRNTQAQSWLRSTHFSVAEIAYLLGYQEPANFTRAFKAWNKCSPLAWRKMQ